MGLVRGGPADWSMQEFVETLEIPEGFDIVLKDRRLNRKINSNGQITWTPTQTVVLTFHRQTLMERVLSCHNSLSVETYQLPTIQIAYPIRKHQLALDLAVANLLQILQKQPPPLHSVYLNPLPVFCIESGISVEL
ncbi:unnamed protein product [Pieris macdunnoughi]|uniref:Uncharacterized protein n=1 Tax=Pieris macdunnoughi TaxID=345717 RepID=A0A821XSD5_9NEOP|nr:unnamed protein product [Pieris macdunnoughi]